VGDLVAIAFRPEFASIGDNEMSNKLTGNVVDVIYSGSIARLKVELVNGDLIVVKKVLGFRRLGFSVGDSITVNISPRNILVYPYPKEGLYKELALD